jgi:hypothetical protein
MKRMIFALAIASFSIAAFAVPPGPPGSVSVIVTNPVLPVRSVDEPARVAYAHFVNGACSFGNSCEAVFPAVPAGKRLRVTNIQMVLKTAPDASGIFVLRLASQGLDPRVVFPSSPFNGAYYGLIHASSQGVDVIIEAGEQPVLEFGIPAGSGTINESGLKFGITGYLVDLTL